MALSQEELDLDSRIRDLNAQIEGLSRQVVLLKEARRKVTRRRTFLFKNPQYSHLTPEELDRLAG